jgi:hypothetical protein
MSDESPLYRVAVYLYSEHLGGDLPPQQSYMTMPGPGTVLIGHVRAVYPLKRHQGDAMDYRHPDPDAAGVYSPRSLLLHAVAGEHGLSFERSEDPAAQAAILYLVERPGEAPHLVSGLGADDLDVWRSQGNTITPIGVLDPRMPAVFWALAGNRNLLLRERRVLEQIRVQPAKNEERPPDD